MERLATERTVVISKPSEEDFGEWRRVVDFAKRHRMVPDGHYLEKQKQWNGDLRIQLMPGTHSNSKPRTDELHAVPVPNQLRSLHPVVAILRDDERWLEMHKDLRRRSLLILQAIAAESARRGHTVREHPLARKQDSGYYYEGRYHERIHSRRDGQIEIHIQGHSYLITILQESPQSTDTNDPAVWPSTWATTSAKGRNSGPIVSGGSWKTSSAPSSSQEPQETTRPPLAKAASALASALDKCRATPRGKIGVKGWAENRYTYCYWEHRDYHRYNARGEVVGYIRYRITVLGKLNPNNRTFKYEAYIDDFSENNSAGGWNHQLKVGFSISNDDNSPDGKADCRPDPNNLARIATFAQWRGYGDNVVVEATFTSPHSSSRYSTDEQRDYCQVRAWGHHPNTSPSRPEYSMR